MVQLHTLSVKSNANFMDYQIERVGAHTHRQIGSAACSNIDASENR